MIVNQEKRFYIKTFGCQMNVADSERMGALLSEQGMHETDRPEDADLVLINGCSVREKPVHKAVSELGRTHAAWMRKSQSRAKPIFAVSGCVAQLEKEKLFKRAPYLDFVFGPDAIDQLPEILHQVENGARHRVYADFDRSQNYSTSTKVFGSRAQAFVNIMKGCDKYCSYCIVPFTRGREKSRLINEVRDDIAALVLRGVREVTLLGQNVNSFGKGNSETFPELLHALDRDPRLAELRRIRFTSSHPLDFSDALVACYAPHEKGGVTKLANHLHLPVQSGSNRVLQKMGRHHKIETYLAQMDHLRELRPNVAITTDLIVGFPGETEEDFEATLMLLEKMRFDAVYAFAYSPRPGTRAHAMPDDVPDILKNERLRKLLALQERISAEKNQVRVGESFEVLVEGCAKTQNMKSPGLRVWTSRTSCNRVVNFLAPEERKLTGKFLTAKVISATALALFGELTKELE